MKDYIREELSCFSEEMSTSTKKKFDFVVVVNRNFKVHFMGPISSRVIGGMYVPPLTNIALQGGSGVL